jgi:hypothetical protein
MRSGFVDDWTSDEIQKLKTIVETMHRPGIRMQWSILAISFPERCATELCAKWKHIQRTNVTKTKEWGERDDHELTKRYFHSLFFPLSRRFKPHMFSWLPAVSSCLFWNWMQTMAFWFRSRRGRHVECNIFSIFSEFHQTKMEIAFPRVWCRIHVIWRGN